MKYLKKYRLTNILCLNMYFVYNDLSLKLNHLNNIPWGLHNIYYIIDRIHRVFFFLIPVKKLIRNLVLRFQVLGVKMYLKIVKSLNYWSNSLRF